jgi:hypothetical protein
MVFKQYLAFVSKHIPADSDKPTDIVQSLACLIAARLSGGGKLPVACGVGDSLDMDIVNAGILAGLEKISEYDSKKGTMRQFLYPTIAGAMQGYAWERENRVSDSRVETWPSIVPMDGSEAEDAETEPALIDNHTPESDMIDLENAKTAYKGITAAVAGLGTEDMAMLLRDAQIGYNAVLRAEWAREIGVSVGALSMRLSRLRREARDWALTVQ